MGAFTGALFGYKKGVGVQWWSQKKDCKNAIP